MMKSNKRGFYDNGKLSGVSSESIPAKQAWIQIKETFSSTISAQPSVQENWHMKITGGGGLGTKSCRANRISHPSYPELTQEALTIIENKIADEVSLGKSTGKFVYNNELYIQFEETRNNNGSNSRITIRKLADAKALGLI